MNSKSIVLVVVGLLIAGAGYFAGYQGGFLGATISPDRSGGSVALYNSLLALYNDVNGTVASVSLDFPPIGALGTTTSTMSTTTAVSGVALGDFVDIAPASSSVSGIAFNAKVISSGVVEIFASNVSTTANINLGTITYNIRVRPFSLSSSATTTPGQ